MVGNPLRMRRTDRVCGSAPCHTRDVSTCGLWCPQGVLEPTPADTQGLQFGFGGSHRLDPPHGSRVNCIFYNHTLFHHKKDERKKKTHIMSNTFENQSSEWGFNLPIECGLWGGGEGIF